ncbi:type VI secretion system baseplate subunit TssF [Marinibactrum halimedae]|nr:type VI secretion system baseplate subunit TssF [Marinibactrum halimedae]MCD9458102.1 type VI secretion system baseplate subunit TssF [Marinibactrum halimedae]
MDTSKPFHQAVVEDVAYINEVKDSYTHHCSEYIIEDFGEEIHQLVDSVAALMSKNRLAAESGISRLYTRLYSQLYPFLLSPLPSMGLVQFNCESMGARSFIPKGTPLIFSVKNKKENSIYRTISDCDIWDISIDDIACLGGIGAGCQLEVELSKPVTSEGCPKELFFYINVEGDWVQSLTFQYMLLNNCIKSYVEYEDGSTEELKYNVGALEELKNNKSLLNSIVRQRLYFHVPQYASFMSCLFSKLDRPWAKAKLRFVFDCSWPDQIRVTPRLFQINTIPVENLQVEESDSIMVDGTVTQHIIQAPNASSDLSIHSIEGVYAIKDVDRIPIRPSLVDLSDNSYDLNIDTHSEKYEISFNMPGAFEDEAQVVIEALWHTPSFSQHLWQPLSVRFHDQDFLGIVPSLPNQITKKMVPYQKPQPISPEKAVTLAAIKNKALLSLEDLILILDSLGSVWKKEYAPIRRIVKNLLSSECKMLNRNGKMQVGIHYRLIFDNVFEGVIPLVRDFCCRVESILNAWITSMPVKLTYQYDLMEDQKDCFQYNMDK